MSVKAIGAAIDIANLTPTQKLVLILLANYADADHACWPSNARLATETGLSPRGVRQAMADLEGLALIARHERKTAGGKMQSNRLVLTFVADPGSTCRPAAPAGVPRQDVPPTPAAGAGVTTLEPSTEPSGANAPDARANLALQFEELSAAWAEVSPGRVSPVKALAAFEAAAASGIDPVKIVAAGRRYLAEDLDVKRLKAATSLHTWLTQQCYLPWFGEAKPAAPGRCSWTGPGAILSAVAAAKDPQFAASYLGRARFDAGKLLTATSLAADRLREALPADRWAELGVMIIEKGS